VVRNRLRRHAHFMLDFLQRKYKTTCALHHSSVILRLRPRATRWRWHSHEPRRHVRAVGGNEQIITHEEIVRDSRRHIHSGALSLHPRVVPSQLPELVLRFTSYNNGFIHLTRNATGRVQVSRLEATRVEHTFTLLDVNSPSLRQPLQPVLRHGG